MLPRGLAVEVPGADVTIVGSGFLQPPLPSAACSWTLSDAGVTISMVKVPLVVHSSSLATCAPPDSAAGDGGASEGRRRLNGAGMAQYRVAVLQNGEDPTCAPQRFLFTSIRSHLLLSLTCLRSFSQGRFVRLRARFHEL